MGTEKAAAERAAAAPVVEPEAVAEPTVEAMPSLGKAEPDRVALLSVLADGTPDQHKPVLLSDEGEEQ